jgi:transposase
MAEFGLVINKGIAAVERRVPEILEDGENCLPGQSRALFARLFGHLRALDHQVKELDAEIRSCHTQNEASLRLAEIPGIGPLTATALVASVGDAKTFHNGRQLAAWLGLVPRQNSTGGKTTLLGISKRGDSYLRMLLILGARSVLIKLKTHPERADGWLGKLAARRNVNIAALALANKNARTAWALLARDRNYQADYRLVGAAV